MRKEYLANITFRKHIEEKNNQSGTDDNLIHIFELILQNRHRVMISDQ